MVLDFLNRFARRTGNDQCICRDVQCRKNRTHMNSTFYVISYWYQPNTAPANRMLAMIQSLSDLGVKTIVIFLMPNREFSKINIEYKNITIEYCWDSYYIDNKIFKYVSYFCYIQMFLSRLKNGNKVLVLGLTDILGKIAKKKNVDVYHERTEHPQAVRLGSYLHHITLQEYLGDCKKLKGLFVISNALKKYFACNGIDEEKIEVINMIVDFKRFDGLKRDIDIEKYIAYCGELSNNKDGVDELIKSFAIVARRHNDVKLYIIGKDPSSKDEMENFMLIDRLGIKERVVFTGMVPAANVPKLLKNAQVLVLDRPDSLQAQYGFPTKLGEYLLSENPVVLTKVGDIPLFFKDGENAILAEQRNSEEFADKICWALENFAEASRIGYRGSKTARIHFNSRTETKKIVEVIFERKYD